MPPEVDMEKRLRDIAEATLELASAEGPSGVTVRAVAARLGGSTTLVTKYLPNRLALLGNAFVYVSEGWQESKTEALEGTEGIERVRALSEWSMQTVNYDDAIRRLWLEVLSGSPKKVEYEVPKEEAHAEYDSIREIVDGAEEPT